MISTLLLILKILGILILTLLGAVLIILLLVLFVPIRYKITAHRKIIEDVPIVVEVKITWLLHILNVAFSYPNAAYVRVRLFCFTVFRTGSSSGEKKDSKKEEKLFKKKKSSKEEKSSEAEKPFQEKETGVKDSSEQIENEGSAEKTQREEMNSTSFDDSGLSDAEEDEPTGNKFVFFFRKLLELFQNIRYTITRIYDKIKDIVNNIQYYIKIIKSDTFSRAWAVCSKQAFSLLKSIGPRKISGTLLIGTGDPASTGQILAIYGILYPLIGNHLDITPDFEQQIVEGDLLIKGKITVIKGLKTAWIVYFNRDFRRLIKLFKKGGSFNGRE